MKPSFVIGIFFFIISCNLSNGQVIKTYPIPSYNIVATGAANFCEQMRTGLCGPSEGKKVMHVISSGNSQSRVQVWIYNRSGSPVLGPYTVLPGETLSVEIDDGVWGVYTEPEGEVILSVWIEEISTPPPGLPGNRVKKSSLVVKISTCFFLQDNCTIFPGTDRDEKRPLKLQICISRG
jgi:hypothetical protein